MSGNQLLLISHLFNTKSLRVRHVDSKHTVENCECDTERHQRPSHTACHSHARPHTVTPDHTHTHTVTPSRRDSLKYLKTPNDNKHIPSHHSNAAYTLPIFMLPDAAANTTASKMSLKLQAKL